MKGKDTLISRVGRIISGGAQKLVEVLESATPEIVMEQTINEIDDAIFDIRAELGKEEAEKHIVIKGLADATAKHKELADQIHIALDENREDLAEAALHRQFDIESQIPILKQRVENADQRINDLTNYISALQAKKREMRDELKEWRSSKTICETMRIGGTAKTDAEIEAKVIRAESAFDRIMSEKSIGNEFDSKHDGKLAELEALSKKNRIKERLTQIKTTRIENKNG